MDEGGSRLCQMEVRQQQARRDGRLERARYELQDRSRSIEEKRKDEFASKGQVGQLEKECL